MTPNFKKKISNPIYFNLFLAHKLPLAFIAGLKLKTLSDDHCQISIKHQWINQNPFGSIYFAALAMAAELSTGVLALIECQQATQPMSMLVSHTQAQFTKKAKGKILFTCHEGQKIRQAIEQTQTTKQGVACNITAVGHDEQQNEIAKFIFTWTFKGK